MNYGNCIEPATEGICTPAPIMENLTEMMKKNRMMTTDVLKMVYRITAHLFGIGKPCCEKEADPKCFRDDLAASNNELAATIDELSEICAMLGM